VPQTAHIDILLTRTNSSQTVTWKFLDCSSNEKDILVHIDEAMLTLRRLQIFRRIHISNPPSNDCRYRLRACSRPCPLF